MDTGANADTELYKWSWIDITLLVYVSMNKRTDTRMSVWMHAWIKAAPLKSKDVKACLLVNMGLTLSSSDNKLCLLKLEPFQIIWQF